MYARITVQGTTYRVESTRTDYVAVQAITRNLSEGWRSGSIVPLDGTDTIKWETMEETVEFDELNPATWLGPVPEGYEWRDVQGYGQRDFFSPSGINLSKFYEVIRDGITAGRSRDEAIALAESLAIHAGILAGTHTVADWDGEYDNNFHCYETGAMLIVPDSAYYAMTGISASDLAVGTSTLWDEDGNAYIYTGSDPR